LAFPDFLGIGAQKAGTQWLARNLSRHPEIWMPPLKELHYFDERIKEPRFGALLARLAGKSHTAEWYDRFWWDQLKWNLQQRRENFELEKILWDLRFFVRSPSDRWYASLFKRARGRVAGEITPAYSVLGEGAIAHVHALMPEAKLVFMMRNPIERIYSSAVMYLDLEGQDPQTATEEQFSRLFDEKGDERTRYLQSLESWRKYYPDERIFVGFLEDVNFHPAALLRRLYAFLDVDASFAQKAIRRKVHARSGAQMPARLAARAAKTYHEELRGLDARFNGYASFWLYAAEELLSGATGQGTIAYPLWESPLWERWAERSSWEGGPQSGSLDSIILR
jgi:hypothetical protein